MYLEFVLHSYRLCRKVKIDTRVVTDDPRCTEKAVRSSRNDRGGKRPVMSGGILTGDLYVLDLGEARCSPNVVEELRGEHVLDLAGGFARTMVLAGKGIARSVAPGSSDAPLVEVLGGGLEEQLAQVAFGSKHVAALTHDGQLYTLGSGVCGQLGHGNTMDGDTPRMVSVLDGRAIAQVACGKSHSLALTSEGDVYSWGAGESGQLGLGKMVPSFTPRYLSALQSTPIALVTTGAAHVAVLSVYGRVYTWGEAMCGQLGLGKPLRNQPLPMEVGLIPLPRPLCFRRHAGALRTCECPLECPLSARRVRPSSGARPARHQVACEWGDSYGGAQRRRQSLCLGPRHTWTTALSQDDSIAGEGRGAAGADGGRHVRRWDDRGSRGGRSGSVLARRRSRALSCVATAGRVCESRRVQWSGGPNLRAHCARIDRARVLPAPRWQQRDAQG